MMTNTTHLEIGRTYLSGNYFNPSKNKVLGFVKWENLPERVRTRQAPHTSRDYERVDGQVWVKFRTFGSVRPVGYLPIDVFTATAYETVEAMVEAYAR